MSDNEAVIRRIFDEIVNQDRIELIDEIFHPEFTSETSQGTLDRDAFRAMVADWRGGFSDIRTEVVDVIDDGGDAIAWSIRATGTHDGQFMGIPATGRSTDFMSINLAWFKDGKPHRHKVVFDLLTMFMQLGLVPEPGAPPASA